MPPPVDQPSGTRAWLGLAEVTPVRSDDEKQTAKCERDASESRPSSGKLEQRELRGSEPDPGEQHKQEPDFGE